MGISDRTTADLTLYAEADGSVSVDTGRALRGRRR